MGLGLGLLLIMLILWGAAKTLFGDIGAWIVVGIALILIIIWICVIVLPRKKGIDKP